MATIDDKIVLRLDVPATTKAINADLKLVQGKLNPIQISTKVDTKGSKHFSNMISQLKEINTLIAIVEDSMDGRNVGRLAIQQSFLDFKYA
ncbi:hypothetical protein [Anaerolentibacter hominis]|uniref:hypothetical protein n=1 Tax=Anaerolentibacter hominis TaxID=3079009 RepID=UPI0031B83F74